MRSPTPARALLLLATLALAACGSDGSGPTEPERSEVAGVYFVCQLTFTPSGVLAPVNLLTTVFETTNTEVQQPRLYVDNGPDLELAYTPRGQFVRRAVRGTYDLSGGAATVRFTDAARTSLLLPEQLDLDVRSSPRQLSVTSSPAYTVPRARYAELSGQPETNLAPQIEGRLAAVFRGGGCN